MAINIEKKYGVLTYVNEPEQLRRLFPNTAHPAFDIEFGEKVIDGANIFTIDFERTHDRIPDIFVVANADLAGASVSDINGFMFASFVDFAHILEMDPFYMYSSAAEGYGLEETTTKNNNRVPRPTQIFYDANTSNPNLTKEGYSTGSLEQSVGRYRWFALWLNGGN